MKSATTLPLYVTLLLGAFAFGLIGTVLTARWLATAPAPQPSPVAPTHSPAPPATLPTIEC